MDSKKNGTRFALVVGALGLAGALLGCGQVQAAGDAPEETSAAPTPSAVQEDQGPPRHAARRAPKNRALMLMHAHPRFSGSHALPGAHDDVHPPSVIARPFAAAPDAP